MLWFVRPREELSLRKCENENARRVFGSSNKGPEILIILSRILSW